MSTCKCTRFILDIIVVHVIISDSDARGKDYSHRLTSVKHITGLIWEGYFNVNYLMQPL